MKAIALMTVAASAIFLGGCAGKAMPAKVVWDKEKPIEFSPKAPSEISDGQANLVFYRDADKMIDQTAVNIGINDRYQASLRGGNYTDHESCAYSTFLSSQVTGKKINDLEYVPVEYRFDEKTNYYFEVAVDENNTATATPVKPEIALEKLKGKQRQSHTISRVVEPNCAPPAPTVVTPAPIVKEKLVLEDLYLYDFDIRVLDANERSRAIEFSNKVQNADFDNYQVYLSGFADPMGDNSYNDKLSNDRAKYVSNIYQQTGIPANKIRLESFGEANPVVEDCAAIQNRTERNECNHRNRRVRAQVTEQ